MSNENLLEKLEAYKTAYEYQMKRVKLLEGHIEPNSPLMRNYRDILRQIQEVKSRPVEQVEQKLTEAAATHPKTEKDKKLAALAEPKNKITHKDVLVGRGVLKKEEVDQVEEAKAPVEHTKKQVEAKLKAGWESYSDIKPGKHAQLFHKQSGKKITVYVKEEVEQMDESSYSPKAARAGKDIGKPGKMFAKIAASAAEKYGSEERGKKVAGAVLKKLRAKK